MKYEILFIVRPDLEESKIKDKKIEKLNKENEKLKLEVENDKNQNKKDR